MNLISIGVLPVEVIGQPWNHHILSRYPAKGSSNKVYEPRLVRREFSVSAKDFKGFAEIQSKRECFSGGYVDDASVYAYNRAWIRPYFFLPSLPSPNNSPMDGKPRLAKTSSSPSIR